MIYNDDVLFIHNGKTAGMSCTHYLLHVLRPPIHLCHAEVGSELATLDVAGVVPHPDIDRHCTLQEGLASIARQEGRGIDDFAKVVVVIRHPFTLEYSFYQHLRKPHIRERRLKGAPGLVALADGPFLDFVRRGGYHRPHHPQERFFLLDGVLHPRVDLVRFESLPTGFTEAVAPWAERGAGYAFPHRNRTSYRESLQDLLTEETKAALYEKHRYLFDAGLYALDAW